MKTAGEFIFGEQHFFTTVVKWNVDMTVQYVGRMLQNVVKDILFHAKD